MEAVNTKKDRWPD